MLYDGNITYITEDGEGHSAGIVVEGPDTFLRFRARKEQHIATVGEGQQLTQVIIEAQMPAEGPRSVGDTGNTAATPAYQVQKVEHDRVVVAENYETGSEQHQIRLEKIIA